MCLARFQSSFVLSWSPSWPASALGNLLNFLDLLRFDKISRSPVRRWHRYKAINWLPTTSDVSPIVVHLRDTAKRLFHRCDCRLPHFPFEETACGAYQNDFSSTRVTRHITKICTLDVPPIVCNTMGNAVVRPGEFARSRGALTLWRSQH